MCAKGKTSENSEKQNCKTSKIFYGMAFNMIKHGFLIFRAYLDMFIDFIFSLFWDGSRLVIPDLDKKHHMLTNSAVKLAALIRNKELKSEHLVQATIERIKAVNIVLNALVDERFEEALKEAREVDKMIENGLPDEYFTERPFLGVPFTAKESHAVANMSHTLGIVVRKHMRASEDAECVRLLRAAGAIPVAVTNIPELNKWQESRNMLFGQTNNPYHTGRTVGGSSGGEAALSAALASPISLCSDIGGSTRMPAFYCGLFALNPTAGYTSLKGSLLRSGLEPTMASIGFVSKHCEDLAPLTRVVAGTKAAELNLDRKVELKDIKYFYVETAQDLRVSPISSDLRKAMSRVIKRITEEFGSTKGAPQPFYHKGFNHMFALWRYWMSEESEDFASMLTNKRGKPNAIVEIVKKVIGVSVYTLAAVFKLVDDQIMPAVDREWAENLTKELREELTMLLSDDGVLLFPSAPAPAPYHYSALLRPFNFAYWAICNVLKFPAAQVPLGLNHEGLPLGIQVVAGPRHDALCLAVAAHLAQQFGGYVPPCRIME